MCNLILFMMTSLAMAGDLASVRELPVTVLGPYAQALRSAKLETLGQVTDLSETQLRLRAKMNSRDLAALKNILLGHKLNLFGQEFSQMGVGPELGLFLAQHGLRTAESLLHWKPYAFLHVRKSGPELTLDELEKLRFSLQYPGSIEDVRTLVDLRLRLAAGEDHFGCGEPLRRIINSDGPRPPNSFRR